MRTEQVLTLIAAAVAIIAVGIAGWQLWEARREAREARQRSESIRRLATVAEGNAEKAVEAAQTAQTQAERAWEQVKLARGQLEEARQEHRSSTQAEQWEWAYAVTTAARALVESSNELIRVASDDQVAPQHRLAAERHYQQASQRWQETMIKAVARIEPELELQQQVITFAGVHQRLHGHLGVLLRAVETDTLSEGDSLSKQVFGLGHELNNAHRHLQRTVSSNLTNQREVGQTTTKLNGQQAVGQQGTGPQAVGQQGAGPQATGPQGAGQQAAVQQATVQQAVGPQAAGQQAVGPQGAGQQGAGQQGTGPQAVGQQGGSPARAQASR